MKATCELCESEEPSILGLTSTQIAAGEKCYSKLVDKLVTWTPETSKDELMHGMRARLPQTPAIEPEASEAPEIVVS